MVSQGVAVHNRGSVTYLMVINHCSATLRPNGWGRGGVGGGVEGGVAHFRDRHTAVVLMFSVMSLFQTGILSAVQKVVTTSL